ncbi:MAG TPA: hypothetical protein VGM07_05180 [Stellaceae bacterium]|jgi:hypothetical protein
MTSIIKDLIPVHAARMAPRPIPPMLEADRASGTADDFAEMGATEFEPMAGALEAVNAVSWHNLRILRLCAWLVEQPKSKITEAAANLFDDLEFCKDSLSLLQDARESMRVQIGIIDAAEARLFIGAAAHAMTLPPE